MEVEANGVDVVILLCHLCIQTEATVELFCRPEVVLTFLLQFYLLVVSIGERSELSTKHFTCGTCVGLWVAKMKVKFLVEYHHSSGISLLAHNNFFTYIR